MVLIILQWNARCLLNNGQEFREFNLNLQELPHIICIQATWLKLQWDFIIRGHTATRNDNESGKGGGVATFVQNG